MPGRSVHCVFDNFLRCVESGLEQNGRPPHLRRRGSQRTVDVSLLQCGGLRQNRSSSDKTPSHQPVLGRSLIALGP